MVEGSVEEIQGYGDKRGALGLFRREHKLQTSIVELLSESNQITVFTE